MNILHVIADCMGLGTPKVFDVDISESKRETLCGSDKSDEEIINEVIQTLLTAEKNGPLLRSRLKHTVGADSWKETIAKDILFNLEQVIRKGPNTLGRALQEAIQSADEAVKATFQFAADHPVLCTLIAIGVLVLLAPWLIEALGFEELGPVEGSFAAWWQSTYEGHVPSGSLFSFFQRLGMVWH